MNGKAMLALGIPAGPLVGEALKLYDALRARGVDVPEAMAAIQDVYAQPEQYLPSAAAHEKAFARAVLARRRPAPRPIKDTAGDYPVYGRELIDPAALAQMDNAMRLPVSVAGAVMPDAHVGFGVPIGCVLATQGAVIPGAVGVDIACRMRMSVYRQSPHMLGQRQRAFVDALNKCARFGVGAAFKAGEQPEHAVLDDPAWQATGLLRGLRQQARAQLGTSGGGNHFADFGELTVLPGGAGALGGLAPGKYLALMTHSGSRGVGFKIANHYAKLAAERLAHLPREMKDLAWLELGTEAGEEYWLSMELAGRFAAANHAVLHESLRRALGLEVAAVIENHHNFAWRETLPDGREAIVHRKGATPAAQGVLGVIPGSMADKAYVVRGLGNAGSLDSASHGAGRQLGRRQAERTLDPAAWTDYLARNGVTLVGGTIDEAPMAYKRIEEVMELQRDMVLPLAEFAPRLVRMAEDTGAY